MNCVSVNLQAEVGKKQTSWTKLSLKLIVAQGRCKLRMTGIEQTVNAKGNMQHAIYPF